MLAKLKTAQSYYYINEKQSIKYNTYENNTKIMIRDKDQLIQQLLGKDIVLDNCEIKQIQYKVLDNFVQKAPMSKLFAIASNTIDLQIEPKQSNFPIMNDRNDYIKKSNGQQKTKLVSPSNQKKVYTPFKIDNVNKSQNSIIDVSNNLSKIQNFNTNKKLFSDVKDIQQEQSKDAILEQLKNQLQKHDKDQHFQSIKYNTPIKDENVKIELLINPKRFPRLEKSPNKMVQNKDIQQNNNSLSSGEQWKLPIQQNEKQLKFQQQIIPRSSKLHTLILNKNKQKSQQQNLSQIRSALNTVKSNIKGIQQKNKIIEKPIKIIKLDLSARSEQKSKILQKDKKYKNYQIEQQFLRNVDASDYSIVDDNASILNKNQNIQSDAVEQPKRQFKSSNSSGISFTKLPNFQTSKNAISFSKMQSYHSNKNQNSNVQQEILDADSSMFDDYQSSSEIRRKELAIIEENQQESMAEQVSKKKYIKKKYNYQQQTADKKKLEQLFLNDDLSSIKSNSFHKLQQKQFQSDKKQTQKLSQSKPQLTAMKQFVVKDIKNDIQNLKSRISSDNGIDMNSNTYKQSSNKNVDIFNDLNDDLNCNNFKKDIEKLKNKMLHDLST